jgi:transposase
LNYIHFVGIDVSKEWLEVAVCGENGDKAAQTERYRNDGDGWAALSRRFASRWAETLVVVESTGGYESGLLAHLLAAGVAVHRAHPLTAKHFLRSLHAAKTDSLDANALARYGAERHRHRPLFRPPDAEAAELATLLARRAELVALRAAEQGRLQHPRYVGLRDSLRRGIRTCDREIARLEARMDELVEQSEPLRKRRAVLESVKGVAQKTAWVLLAALPELGSLTRRQAASLAGCAPYARDSGQHRGYRRTGGGRALVRRALFLACWSAVRYNPTLKPFYDRLRQNGKKPLVALVAAMRKLITILNAKLRDTLAGEIPLGHAI